MRRYWASMTMAALVLCLSSCGRSGSGPGQGKDVSAPEEPAGGEAESRPMPLTDERLDRYLRYRKDLREITVRWTKEIVDFAKSIDSKSTDVSKGLTAVKGSMAIGEKREAEIKALREKHGFTESEDQRLSSAIDEVVAARPSENPSMAGALKNYRDIQAAGGDQKKVADEMLKGLEDQEKEGLARARETYGDAWVEVLSRRIKELAQLQIEDAAIISGEGAGK